MKRLITIMAACLLGWGLQAQTDCRYWFDNDYSAHVTVSTSTQPLQLDVGNLRNGFHTVYMIFRDSTTVWSQPRMGLFYSIGSSMAESADSTYAYWFDANDDNMHSGTLTGGMIEMDVNGLSVGFHTMYMRIGGELRNALVYKAPQNATVTVDSSFTYWYDNDYSQHYDGMIVGGIVEFNTGNLRDGFHTLYMRVGAELRNALFYKMPQEDSVANDSVYSYWFDTDSTIRTGSITDSILMLDVADLTDAYHAVYMMIGTGKSAQLKSGMFNKVPVIYTVTLASADSTRGSVSGAGDYPRNSTVSISATAEYGYHFSMWSDGDTNALRGIYLTQDTSLIAYFVPDTFQFDITVGDTSMGTVVVTGTSEYLGTDTAMAIPNYGYHFTGWSDGDTTNPRLVILTQDTTLTATFAPNIYTVTLLTDTPEWGSVIGAGEYPYLTTVPLEAVATYGYQFKQWNDGNTQNPRQLVVRGDTTLTATFELLRYHLTVNSNDISRGFTQGGGTFTVMDTATALAITLAGNSFLGWADGDMTNPRQLQLSSDTTLTAIFQALDSMPETIIVHDTTVVTDTVTEYETVHDTTVVVDTLLVDNYIYDTVTLHDTTVVTDTVINTMYDTIVNTMYDTVVNTVYDTTVVTDTVTMTEYVPVHDTTYIDVPVHDTTVVTLTDTIVNTVYDTVDNYIYDTVVNTVYDTVINTVYDTVTNTEYVYDTVTNTIYDTVTNTVYDTVTNTVYDTTVVDNYIYDTTIVTDTLWMTLYDTVWLTDTIYIHDTIYVQENGIDAVATTNVRLYQRDGQIVVEDADGGMLPEVAVYDAVGRMVNNYETRNSKFEIDVPASGVYLVKIGDRPARRIVVIR